jgi:hypothetical protein
MLPVSKSMYKFRRDPVSVGLSVCLSGSHLGPATNFSPSSWIIFKQLQVCWCGEPSLMRGRVCSVQLLLGIASCLSRVWVPRDSCPYFNVSIFYTPPTWRARNIAAQLYSQALGCGLMNTNRNSRKFPIESLTHDIGRTLVRAEYGYRKESPNTNS